MKERIDFGEPGFEGRLKIYSIVKRERRPRSLLSPRRRPFLAPDFSWPPKKRCQRISDFAARDRGDKE
ncbi:MAG: hypothetical protein IK015_07290 [Treponema sp.]|nr:hypothetical protein [Treponema sp.]